MAWCRYDTKPVANQMLTWHNINKVLLKQTSPIVEWQRISKRLTAGVSIKMGNVLIP